MSKNENKTLERQIRGAVKCTIDAHGPISHSYLSSAVKRIMGNLDNLNKINYPDEPLKESLIVLCSKYHAQIVKLRKHLNQKNLSSEQKAYLGSRINQLRNTIIDINRLLKQKDIFNSPDAN